MNQARILSTIGMCAALLTAWHGETYGDESKPREVKVGALTLTVPESWEQQKPSSGLRLAQFAIAAVDGDQAAAELTIFNFGGGGSAQANVDRWIGQFQSDGRKANVTKGVAPVGEYVWVDVRGTFKKPVGPPILRKTEPMPGARMLAVFLSVRDEGNYFLKITGPEATVTSAEEAFRACFGGKVDDEKPFDSQDETP